ncbi:MAG: NAD(+)/NADH kinase [Chloroflexota bacterium]|jgi:NAD+ kinase
MNLIGILQQSKIAESEPLANKLAEWLAAQGITSWTVAPVDDEELDVPFADTSLLVVLGGDGSTLRAARWAVPYGIPIFGINIGRVGFLSEATPENWSEKMTHVLSGDYWIERRMMLNADLRRRSGEQIGPFIALNEVVIGRGAQARVVRAHLWVDEDLVTTYTADALIVSTPTGSTAYAMAASGPLMPPQLQNFVVVPVAAHLSLNRSIVLHEDAHIRIEVEVGEAYLTADGQKSVAVEHGDHIIMTKHEHPCCFVRVEGPGHFYRRLMSRLGFSWPHL